MGNQIKRILVYRWQSICEPVTIDALEKLGYEVIELKTEMKDYHADSLFARDMITLIHKESIDLVFSYDYYPMISMICNLNHIPYASWIYDCPLYTLQSKTLPNFCNYIFCFDEKYTEQLKARGAVHVKHFPLAGDLDLYLRATCYFNDFEKEKNSYQSEISFVGSLYNGNSNKLRHVNLSKEMGEYVDWLLEMQKDDRNVDFLYKNLTPQLVKTIVQDCELALGEFYDYKEEDLVIDTILLERSARDREETLLSLAKEHPITFYTTSTLTEDLKKSANIIAKEKVDYWKQMPLVFYNSKINLNITTRSIETGIPQRVFDILSCEGFCLTNYQKEIADNFADGKELVIYRNEKDLHEKIQYYLSHEEERKAIARAGFEKIKEKFAIENRIKELIRLCWD